VLGAIKSGASAASRSLAVVAQLELVAVGAVLLVLAALLLRRELRRWRAGQGNTTQEVRARAVMGELCPNGWQAQLTLYGPGRDAPNASPAGPGALVAVDWSELAGEGDEPPPLRRVWAATIDEGLVAMVADRRTDEVLERIERSAGVDDDPWDSL
jgi:hypothetical protein